MREGDAEGGEGPQAKDSTKSIWSVYMDWRNINTVGATVPCDLKRVVKREGNVNPLVNTEQRSHSHHVPSRGAS